MKKFLTLFLCFVLLFTSCGDNSTVSSDISSEVTSSEETMSVEEAVSSEEVVSIDEVSSEVTSSVEESVSSVEEVSSADTASRVEETVNEELSPKDYVVLGDFITNSSYSSFLSEEFGWNAKNLPEYLGDWVDGNRFLFYTLSSNTDGSSVVKTSVFLYSIEKRSLLKLGETEGANLIKTFKYDGKFYLLHQGDTDQNNLFEIDLVKKVVNKSVVGKISGEISKSGKILYDGGTSVKICDFLNGKNELNFEKKAGYEFLSWSPDGKHTVFKKGNKYAIYDLDGELILEKSKITDFKWCNTSKAFTYRSLSKHGLFLFDFSKNTETKISNKTMPVFAEPEFSVWYAKDDPNLTQYMLLNHKTGNEYFFSLLDGKTEFTFTNYNPDFKAFLLMGKSEIEEFAYFLNIEEDGQVRPFRTNKKVTESTKNAEGHVKTDLGPYYMYLPEKPSDDLVNIIGCLMTVMW